MKVRLYLDEDSLHEALVRALQARDIDVVTALDAGMFGRSDADQLHYATTQERVLVTRNVRDFSRLHRDFLGVGRAHAGIILVQQHWRSGPSGE